MAIWDLTANIENSAEILIRIALEPFFLAEFSGIDCTLMLAV